MVTPTQERVEKDANQGIGNNIRKPWILFSVVTMSKRLLKMASKQKDRIRKGR